MQPESVLLTEASLIFGGLPPQYKWAKSLKAALLQTTQLLEKLVIASEKCKNPNVLLKPLIPNEMIPKRKQDLPPTYLNITARGNLANLNTILSYNQAIENSLALLERDGLSIEYLKSIHAEILSQDIEAAHGRAGSIRERKVYLRNNITREIRYTAPPAEDLPNLLKKFEFFMNDRTLPPLIHAAVCHADFMNIHPFHDGNGRVGYLMTMVLLVEKKVIPAHMLNLFVLFSYAYFHATQAAYAKLIRSKSPRQRTEWLIYFLDIVSLIANEILSRIESIHQIIDNYQRILLSKKEIPTLALMLVHQLPTTPWFTPLQMAHALKVSPLALQKAIAVLESHYMIAPRVDPSNGATLYCSYDLIEILEKNITYQFTESA